MDNDEFPRSAGDQLLHVDDVSRWFAVTRDWVYDEVEAGRLPFIALGRKHLRFRREELEAHLDTPGEH